MIHPTDGNRTAHLAERSREGRPADATADMIEGLVARISEFEALVGKPRKTSTNSHIPPSKDGIGLGKGKKHHKSSGG